MGDPLDYVAELNQRIRRGCTAHLAPKIGRLYYMNHETKTSSWLPPVENWNPGGTCLPYGWEAGLDPEGRSYYINHVNKTSTYEDPRKDNDEEPPEPRVVDLVRDSHLGFGFVAGSEKPVIVRFVTEGGPSEHNLLPGDQILKINGEDVLKAPREHVIDLVRSCKHSVTLMVCQPQINNTTRKSAILSAAKKAKLKNNPSRVRFAQGVVINGSPLYCPSSMESYVTFLPNVMKVFLENGQTKSFKYDNTTTVTDVLKSLQEKLSIKCMEHFSLMVEHVKSMRRNKLILLDPKDTLSKIAAWPGAHHLRCVFRVAFVPKDAQELLQKDPVSFEYFYMQSCNDVVQERFAPELKYDIALRLASLHIQHHVLSSNANQGKINLKALERDCGLDRFVPISLLETMKRKELRKLLGHFLKQNQFLGGQKQLTALQAKLHYLKIISELPSYGAKCFYTNLKDSTTETALLVSPKFGISQISSLRSIAQPMSLALIEEVSSIHVAKDDELTFAVEINLKNPDRDSLVFSLEDREAEELVLLLKGYHKLLVERDIPVDWEDGDPWRVESAPCYHGKHLVEEAPWSYPARSNHVLDSTPLQPIDFSIHVPQYENRLLQNSRDCNSSSNSLLSVDHNANETQRVVGDFEAPHHRVGFDLHSVVSIELLEEEPPDDHPYEARNREVFRRVTEASRIVADAEDYLLDTEGQRSGNGVAEDELVVDDPAGKIRPADSLLLLSQLDRRTEESPEKAEDNTSESDTDSLSTPNDSPLHSARLRDSPQLRSRNRTDSSFGLHSPDLLPDCCPSGDVMELLRRLQTDSELPFTEESLYLDTDLIDLTMESEHEFGVSEEKNDAGRIVAELDDLCEALFELRTRNLLDGTVPTIEEEVDIDYFIANATVPPPPDTSSNELAAREQDEVLKRFRKVSDDMRRIFGDSSECHSDHSDDSSGYETFSSPPSALRTSVEAPKAPPRTRKMGETSSDGMGEQVVARSVSWNDFEPVSKPPLPPSSPSLEKAKKALQSCSIREANTSATLPRTLEADPSRRGHAVDRSFLVSGSGCGNLTGSNGVTTRKVHNNVPDSTVNNNNNCNGNNALEGGFLSNEQYVILSRGGGESEVQSLVNGYIHVKALNGNAAKYNLIEDEDFAEEEEELLDGQLSAEIRRLVHRLDLLTGQNRGHGDTEKFDLAREALMAESRQFVTASKLFVKGATEESPEVGQHLSTCFNLLERIFTISELVLAQMVSRPQVESLIERLKDVALAFSDTVHAARLGKSSPDMCHASSTLATALTTLMRTLRSFATP